MEHVHLEHAGIFKAFCDETRLEVLELLRSGEKCACVLLERLSVGQSTLSHHMKILVESGVVSARREGKWIYYSIDADGCERVAELLKRLTAVSDIIDETANARCCE